jgi:hypothetical protein
MPQHPGIDDNQDVFFFRRINGALSTKETLLGKLLAAV